MDKINWAILGPGTIAGDFAKAISEVNGSIYAVGARSLDKAEKFSSDYTVEKIYGNYTEMLKDEKIDIVYISTPHSNHYEYIMESLKNQDDEMAVISLTMRAKQPKRGIVCGELGYITVENFPRADKATITYPDGSVEVIQDGDMSKALIYEVQDMNDYIMKKNDNDTLGLSVDVMNIMDEVRNQWGLKYSFE